MSTAPVRPRTYSTSAQMAEAAVLRIAEAQRRIDTARAELAEAEATFVALLADAHAVPVQADTTGWIKLSDGMYAIVDIEDMALVSAGPKWYTAMGVRTAYARRNFVGPDGVRTSQYLHNLLTGFEKTDHINGNGLDNRRCNLREASQSENAYNRRKAAHGRSRFKGVSWNSKDRNWRVTITVAGKRRHVGQYADEAAAAAAYDTAAREAHGSFAALNFPQPGERYALDVKDAV